MPDHDLSIVSGSIVRSILEGREDLVLEAVTNAYLAHAAGQTRSPRTQPLFTDGGRFFAMPASIADTRPIVGVKWVGSFVGNLAAGGERASATLIVNDAVTGRPVAVVDGTLISAKRTAAGAAIALRLVAQSAALDSLGLVGCGPINYEVLRFVNHVLPVTSVYLADLDPARVEAFAARVRSELPSVTPVASTLDEVLESADAVSFATNTSVPHIHSLPARPLVVLHISLRDLAPSVIAGAYNIVDDVEHVCSARTSVHLASEELGHTGFIRGTIADLLSGALRYERPNGPTIVSPFGMAILDLAVLRVVLDRTASHPEVTRVPDFRGSVWA
ncbi:MAG: 2,3-diaminopropionate biosynthesis protein SbnB [Acidobacteria bacterium]|nr:2,3-diaminopropionate biosynthesis protein SbnB [Acidobacteriota bacterium]